VYLFCARLISPREHADCVSTSHFPSALVPISRLTALISSKTSSLVRRPFRTNTRRVASCSIIIARSSSSKVTTWRGSSFSANLAPFDIFLPFKSNRVLKV